MSFKKYLEKECFTASSIRSYGFQADKFIQWNEQQGYGLCHFDYKKALRYVEYLRTQHDNKKTINGKITATRRYFDYLMERGEAVENPFTEILIKGDKTRKMLHALLSHDELEDLYYSYPTEQYPRRDMVLASKRNKVMLGFMVYQALSTTDMKRLQLEHVRLSKGRIYVPSGKIGGRRELALQPWQIMELMEYLNEVHPEICRRKRICTETLFISPNGRLTDTVAHIIKKGRYINKKLRNIHQIRASVIVHWLTKYNLRQVQIMAGHRRISTTERYVQEDLKQLQNVINAYHPLS